jgi:hypothetical protein
MGALPGSNGVWKAGEGKRQREKTGGENRGHQKSSKPTLD